MSLDLDRMRRRSHVVMAISLLAGVCAAAGIYGYLQLHQPWTMALFVAAAVVGFGCQIWFIIGLRGPKNGGA